MDQRFLGRTGVSVSPLCLGAMMFGAWGEPDHDVVLDDALLDRIDEIVAPGTTINPTDAGWTNPALAPAARRR